MAAAVGVAVFLVLFIGGSGNDIGPNADIEQSPAGAPDVEAMQKTDESADADASAADAPALIDAAPIAAKATPDASVPAVPDAAVVGANPSDEGGGSKGDAKTAISIDAGTPEPARDKPVRDKPVRDKPVRDKPVRTTSGAKRGNGKTTKARGGGSTTTKKPDGTSGDTKNPKSIKVPILQ